MSHERISSSATPPPFDWKTPALFSLPLILLIGVIALLVAPRGAGLQVEPAAPLESLTFDRTILHPGEFELHIRNTSPQDITIAAAHINDGFWRFSSEPSATIPRL